MRVALSLNKTPVTAFLAGQIPTGSVPPEAHFETGGTRAARCRIGHQTLFCISISQEYAMGECGASHTQANVSEWSNIPTHKRPDAESTGRVD